MIYQNEHGKAKCQKAMNEVGLPTVMETAYHTIQAGVKLKDHFSWIFADNFEWAEGYSERFGLVHVNFRTLTRSPKKSFYWYKQVIENNYHSLF